MLMDLMEDSRCAPDNRQELLNCKMIVIRSSIEDIKKSIVVSFLCCVQQSLEIIE